MDNVQRVLTKKLIKGELAHLIIFESLDIEKEELSTWSQEIINEYFFNLNQSKVKIENNPDVLIINEENYLQKKFYDKKIIKDITQFLSHKAITGNKKFILIDDSRYLSEIHMNKLLKTFEEPPVEMNLFLLNPTGSRVLPTVSSRAVTIRCPKKPKPLKNTNKDIEKSKDEALYKFIEKCKKNDKYEDDIAKNIIDNAHRSNSIHLIMNLNLYLKAKVRDAEYNYSKNSRLIYLYKSLQLLAS